MMIPALVLSLLAQGEPQTPDYKVPLRTSSETHHTIIDIEKALVDKQYAAAEKLSGLLPRGTVTYRVDTSKVADAQKKEFEDAIRDASQNWEQVMGKKVDFQYVTGSKADISFSFEPVLAKIVSTGETAGATWFFATEPTPPLIEAVFGLKRGPKLDRTLSRDVFNESMFTFGRYLGLAPSPKLGGAMGRIEGPMPNPSVIDREEWIAARKILALAESLRTAIHKREAIDVGHPSANFEKTTLKFERVFQGDQGRAQLLVTNKGTAPLELSVQGDCGCIGGSIVPSLDPGKSAFLTGIFDTRELVGDVHHFLIVHTNDPDQPIVSIPVSITVTPRAEAIFPTSNVAYVDSGSNSFVFYIHSEEKPLFNIKSVATLNSTFKVRFDPFSGEVGNYLKPGKKQVIHGYKATVDLSQIPKEAIFGRPSGLIQLATDNPKLPNVRFTFFLQRGIVSLPERVYFGSPRGPIDSFFLLSRPGRPFTIKKVSCAEKSLSFQITKNELFHGAEYTIRALYDGSVPGHRFKSEILIETDDPKQSLIRIPVQTNGV